MRASLELSLGSPESDPMGTYLYLTLSIPGVEEFEIRSTGRLDDIADRDVLEEFEKTLNMASLTRKSLNLPCHLSMEDMKEMCVDLSLQESTIRELLSLVKEFNQELKGETLE